MSNSNHTNDDKLDMQSPDLVQQNIEKLAELFPNCLKESETGKAIDFDLLKQELNHAVVEGNKERYRLEWPGKREAIVTANLPTTKTLRPVREDSVDFDNTENLYIEGDNLEVLKLLQESYLGKIKMIYIDPPYNTGKDFIYKDNFANDKDGEFLDSGQINDMKQRLFVNPEASGRYHSDWLTMIYPRLKLARNLLKDDGLIFISIDDNEKVNLKKICDEIFGEENHVNTLVWKKRYNAAKEKHLALIHEYVLIYARKLNLIEDFTVPGDQEYFDAYFNETDEYLNIRGKFMTQPLEAGNSMDVRPNLRFPIISPDGSEIWPRRQWVWGKDRVEDAKIKGQLKFYKSKEGEWKVRHKQYMRDEFGQLRKVKPFSIYDKVFTQNATVEFSSLFKNENIFPFPKPSLLIAHLIQLSNTNNGIVLDFFSGSATTADAIQQLNSIDGGSRKYILVQIPELLEETSDAHKAGFKSIAEIGKERIRRAAKKIKDETGANIDYGFRVYRLDESNMQDVYYRPQDLDQAKMDLFGDNVKPDRTEDDLLAQVMLDWGLPLSLKIEQANVAGKKVFKVAENSLFACFDKGIDEAFAKEIAKEKPLRIVFKDAGFKDDTAKTNVKQLLKQLSPETEMKVL